MRFFHKFHGHQHDERHFARHEHGPHMHHRFGRGGRLARFLEHGDLRLLVLRLISEKPRHGYEIIKAIEELAGGAYAPSPGVIYPTLTMLEELGQIESTAEGARKNFSITEAGLAALAENQAAVDLLFARMQSVQTREAATPVIRAMENLRTALRLKLGRGEPAPEMTRKIADMLDGMTRQIEEL